MTVCSTSGCFELAQQNTMRKTTINIQLTPPLTSWILNHNNYWTKRERTESLPRINTVDSLLRVPVIRRQPLASFSRIISDLDILLPSPSMRFWGSKSTLLCFHKWPQIENFRRIVLRPSLFQFFRHQCVQGWLFIEQRFTKLAPYQALRFQEGKYMFSEISKNRKFSTYRVTSISVLFFCTSMCSGMMFSQTAAFSLPVQ